MSTKSVLVYGPHGCGKTANAHAIAKALGLKKIHDNWVPGSPVAMLDTLVLTNDLSRRGLFPRRVISYEQAMQIVQHGGGAV